MAPSSEDPSFARKAAASASLLGTASLFAFLGADADHHGMLLWALIVGVASVGLTRRSLVVQTLSRATAWAAIVLMTFEKIVAHAQRDGLLYGVLGTSVAALLLSRPLLHTKTARESFDPRVYRPWFLAGAISTGTMGMLVVFACLGFASSVADLGLFDAIFIAIASGLLASAVGLVRMRAWAILLGGGLSALLVLAGALSGDRWMAILGVPALLLQVLPVIVARRAAAEAPPVGRVRFTHAARDEPRRRAIDAEAEDAAMSERQLARNEGANAR